MVAPLAAAESREHDESGPATSLEVRAVRTVAKQIYETVSHQEETRWKKRGMYLLSIILGSGGTWGAQAYITADGEDKVSAAMTEVDDAQNKRIEKIERRQTKIAKILVEGELSHLASTRYLSDKIDQAHPAGATVEKPPELELAETRARKLLEEQAAHELYRRIDLEDPLAEEEEESTP